MRIKIKHMEIAIIRRESTGTGVNTYNETETVAKFEIMDGAPVRGELSTAMKGQQLQLCGTSLEDRLQ